MKDNPELRAMESALEARRLEVGAARSHLLPHISVEERFMRTNNPMYAFGSKLNQSRITASDFNPAFLNEPKDIEDYQTSVTVEQALFAPEAFVGLRMAKREADASGSDLQRKKEEVALNVIKAYLNIITARNYLEVAGKGLLDASEHHRIAEARHRAGLGLYSDTLRTDVAVRQAEENLLRADKGMKLAGRMLSLLMGLEGPVTTGEAEPGFDVLSLDESLAAALKRHDLMAMETRVDNAGDNIKLAGAKYLPVLGAGGAWQLNSGEAAFGSDAESYSVMAFLKWDFYDGGLRKAQRQKAIAQKSEAEAYLEGLKKQVAFRVYEAHLELEEAQSGLELAEARLKLAGESQRLIKSRYENSLTTVVELMDAQSALNASRAAVVEKHNNYSVAAAELMYQSGIILDNYREENGGIN
jgi:outer membrane protein TolC